MLVELGPRTISTCQFASSQCQANNGMAIVSEVFLRESGETKWVCKSCLTQYLKKKRRLKLAKGDLASLNFFSEQKETQ